MRNVLLAAPLLLLAACQGDMAAPLPPTTGPAMPDPLRALGTEPFWAAVVSGGTLTYSTPENQSGTQIAVSRGGSGQEAVYSGNLGGQSFIMRVTAGRCSDGMSDRTYPYVVSLTIGSDRRQGCAIADKDWPSPGG